MKLLKRTIYGVLIIFGLLVLYHGVVSEDFSAGIAMALEDVNVSATCPGDVDTVLDFIMRSKVEGDTLRTYKRFEAGFPAAGTNWSGRICELGLSDALDIFK